jgi:hypothetical protein
MKPVAAKVLLVGMVVAVSLFLLVGRAKLLRASGGNHLSTRNQLAKISIGYPQQGAVFPPEITPRRFFGATATRERSDGWFKSRSPTAQTQCASRFPANRCASGSSIPRRGR